ncbi:hypothetical protein M231_03872 [Tremella mesenterica]|uniref:RING-type E3 ubiquitin transferase n=1 Tax=Tremella mesenterica TaxID=5217 RepID=A0A4V1M418_TREME|nr:hypothetical protein M231_03872 [Tremella mesenterica]
MDPGPSRQPLPPPPLQFVGNVQEDRLTFPPASQAQILRAQQRDSSQIYRLTELASELLRSLFGTRWLAHRQTIVDLTTRAVYLFLTLGRGQQTLGEEYTDIVPFASKSRRLPSRTRRMVTIILLLIPSILTSPSTITYLRNDDSRWCRTKRSLADVLESPWARIGAELHLVAFLLRGRFFDLARRLTGMTYISTLPARPPEQTPSYEPLGLLLLIALLNRLISTRMRAQSDPITPPPNLAFSSVPLSSLPLSPPLTPPPNNEVVLLSARTKDYDRPNTYLSPSAQILSGRQCTLCLEPRGTGEGSGGTVGVTECGHVFCWGCLGGLDKRECPLCRQGLRMERLVAAYNL